MKTITLLVSLLFITSASYADMLGISVELSRRKEQTTVSLRCGFLTDNNRDAVSVEEAAKVLRSLEFHKDAKFAVIHSADFIPSQDLVTLLEALQANEIGIYYVQIGPPPPTGMDRWNRK